MMQRLRTILAWLMVAMFFTGNSVSAFTEAGEHLHSGPAHTHAHVDFTEAAGHRHQAETALHAHEPHPHDASASAGDAPCAPAGNAGDRAVCHLHAHCCFFSVFMPESKPQFRPSAVGARLEVERGKVRTGHARYPLLRPPRDAA